MVDSPEYGHRHRGAWRALHLGLQQAWPADDARSENLFRVGPLGDVRLTQRTAPRPERRLSLQRAHGAAPAADFRGAATAAGWYSRMDAATNRLPTGYRASRALFHPRHDLLRGLQPGDRGLASARFLQRRDGAPRAPHPGASD